MPTGPREHGQPVSTDGVHPGHEQQEKKVFNQISYEAGNFSVTLPWTSISKSCIKTKLNTLEKSITQVASGTHLLPLAQDAER